MSDSIQRNNPKLKSPSEVTTCPKCGAPLLSEVCQYCGSYGGEVATGDLTAEYPMIKCKLAKFTFFSTIFPLIFAFAFGIGGLIGGIFFHFAGLCLIFLVIGVAAAVIAIRNTIIVCSNKSKGKVVKGTVYGYMDDTISYNNVNGQQVKLLIDTQDGKRFLLIPLATTEKPYPVNSTVNVRVYRNTAYILDDIPNL